MAADPNQNQINIDTSQLTFNVNDEKCKMIGKYNGDEVAFIEFTINGLFIPQTSKYSELLFINTH